MAHHRTHSRRHFLLSHALSGRTNIKKCAFYFYFWNSKQEHNCKIENFLLLLVPMYMTGKYMGGCPLAPRYMNGIFCNEGTYRNGRDTAQTIYIFGYLQ
jgi:hypothetical protein